MPKNLRIKLPAPPDSSYTIRFEPTLRSMAHTVSRVARIVFLISDSNVSKVWAGQYSDLLSRAGTIVHSLHVRAGERSKTRNIKAQLEDRLIALGAGRDSVIVALGGGMIGDLAGFLAATYLRGVRYIQIPTSLLAQVDSSVGGKVAVDHPRGKNLIGAFHQPALVCIHIPMLTTLPPREFSNGMAEVIKYGAIMDEHLLRYLESHARELFDRTQSVLGRVVRRCCELKGSIVEADERETGIRRILNFGHTIGHAVELLSGYSLRHGESVAIGMVAEARISSRLGLLSEKEVGRLIGLLRRFHLPTEIPRSLTPKRIIRSTLTDKKALNGAVRYTLLERLGRARIDVALTSDEVRELLFNR